jgi:hypothetical protein
MYGNVIQHVCLGNGNYNREQYNNHGTKYCIDDDGFVVTAHAESTVQC